MPATPRSTARRTALLAQIAGLAFLPAGALGVYYGLKKIPDPQVAPPDDIIAARPTQAAAAPRAANTASIGRMLTVAAAFPTPDRPPTGTGGEGVPTSLPPARATGPTVRFLGAIAEPNQFVALLSIDDHQKFVRIGQTASTEGGTVKVVACDAGSVQIVTTPPGVDINTAGESARQTLQIAARSGPSFTTPNAAPSAATGPAATLGTPDAPAAPAMPGLPPGFTPPPGMSPQQIEQIRQNYQRAQRESGDGSQ